MTRKVMFSIPTHDRRIFTGTMLTLFNCMPTFMNRNWDMGINLHEGTTGVHIGRNSLVRRFMETDFTDIFFIDADVSCHPQYVIKMIEHPVDFVLGLYRHKTEEESYALLSEEGMEGQLVRDENTGLVSIRGAGAGFMRLKRCVIEKMTASLKETEWMLDGLNSNRPMPALFDFGYIDGKYHGEDIYFCLRWKRLGEQVWLDPDLQLQHFGTHIYNGNFMNSWESKECIYGSGIHYPEEARRKFEEVVGQA